MPVVFLLVIFITPFHGSTACIRTIDPAAEDGWSLEEQMTGYSVLMTTVMEQTTAEPTSTAASAPTTTTTGTSTTTSMTTTSTTTTTTSTTTTTTTGVGVCPSNWDLNPMNNFCYTRIEPPSGSLRAEPRCNNFYSGSHAASIHNADENEFIRSRYTLMYPDPAVGDVILIAPGMGTYSDGTPYGAYQNWQASEPAGPDFCILMNAAGEWYPSALCTGANAVVCQIAAT